MKDSAYYVYMLECSDGSLYTGISNRLAERVRQHNLGKASHCTAARRPVRLVYSEEQPDRSAALKRESAIKKLSRPQKMALLKQGGEDVAAASQEQEAGEGAAGGFGVAPR